MFELSNQISQRFNQICLVTLPLLRIPLHFEACQITEDKDIINAV